AFLFGFASGQLVIGTLSDRFGRRQPLLISLAVCTVASIGCALAPGITLLIVLRFVQGFTGAAGVVIGRSIIRDLSEGRAAVKAFSVLAAIVSFAPVVAPLLGGTLLPLVSWRGVLGVIAASTLLMVVVIYLFMPESLAEEHRTDGGIGATFRIAGSLFSNRIYVGYLTILAFTYGAVFAYVSASPFVFQNVFGLSARWYSIAFTFNALGLILASAVNTRIVYRIDPARTLLAAQVTLLVVGLLLGTSILTGVATIATVLPMTFLMLTSIGFTVGNSTALAMNSVKHGVGTAAALLGAVQFTFGAVVSPVVGLGGEDTAVPMVAVIMVSTSLSFIALLVTRHMIASRASEPETQQGRAARPSLSDHSG
ncbi:MAG TPA: multidrug effflux MFS transporter, partial [Thermomicrobiales bacterium]|nr:multidrug effflux MFS transporter [Thermomicrobiales bacterium]